MKLMRSLVGLLVLVLVGCNAVGVAQTTSTSTAEVTTTTATPTTTTPTTIPLVTTTTLSLEEVAQLEFDADVALIKSLQRGASDSWFQGWEAAAQYQVDNNHPAMTTCSYDDFLVVDGPEGYREEHVVDGSTIERDDSWVSPSSGEIPDGRIYIYQVTSTYSADGLVSSSELAEVHAAIINDRAYFFFSCG